MMSLFTVHPGSTTWTSSTNCSVDCHRLTLLFTWQKRYSTIEKETLGLMLALNHFDVYLNPTVMPIIVYTDHNPIVFINKMKEKNQRLLRWSLTLQQYNVDIRHIRGRENVMADALSRI